MLDLLREMPPDSVDLVLTSPPYWSLRDYGEETKTVWGGSEGCEHEWSEEAYKQHAGRGDCQRDGKYSEQESIPDKVLVRGSCSKCGAWRGSLGLEPTFHFYVDHLLEVFAEVKRVLKPTGAFYLNIGDTYAGGKAHSDWTVREDYPGNRWDNGHSRPRNPKWDYKVAIISNIHAARHFDEYLASLKDIVWTLDSSGRAKKVSDLPLDHDIYNLFDGLVALTSTLSRDEWITEMFEQM